MNSSFYIVIRMGIVVAFLLGLPILALPRVHEFLGSFGTVEVSAEAMNDAPSNLDARYPNEHTITPPLFVAAEPMASRGTAWQESPPTSIEMLKHEFVELGATYLALERVGVENDRFRFACNIPLGDGSPYMKRFQVMDPDPAEAMRRVLADVRRWRVAALGQQVGGPQVKTR